MLQRLFLFKTFCENHVDESIKLTEVEWAEVNELVEILKPIYFATQKLQIEQLYLGDFYKIWLELTLTVKAMRNSHSAALQEAIEKREEALTSSKLVTSAIYLDPRMRRVLLQNQIKLMCARTHLTKLFRQINGAAKKVSTIYNVQYALVLFL